MSDDPKKRKMVVKFGEDDNFEVVNIPSGSNQDEKDPPRKLPGTVIRSEAGSLKFQPDNLLNVMETCLTDFFQETGTMHLTHKQTDTVVDLNRKLIEAYTSTILDAIKKEETINNAVKSVQEVSTYVNDELNKASNSYKRLKKIRENKHYVEPVSIPLALKWSRTKTVTGSDLPDERLIQSTSQFVSIKQTLINLFSQQDFQDVYLKYNVKDKHICKDGIYMDFCCGTTYKKHRYLLKIQTLFNYNWRRMILKYVPR